jgi:polyphosphate glucokinase
MDRKLTSGHRAPLSKTAASALLREPPQPKMKVLAIDIGGNNVKLIASGQEEPRRFASGPTLTPKKFISEVKRIVADWPYDVVSIGYPGKVQENRPVSEPKNLGSGWKGFNFEAAFKVPVKVINDAAMQALGSYKGGKMLFLGLGTGLGSAIVLGGVAQPMELGHLPYKRGTFESYIGRRGLDKYGRKKWRRRVEDVVQRLIDALTPEDVVMGGGNARKLKRLPKGCRPGNNYYAFLGGFRLWTEAQANARETGGAPLSRRSTRRQTTLRKI